MPKKSFSKSIKIGLASIVCVVLLVSFLPKFDFLNKDKEKIVAKIDSIKITEYELQNFVDNDIANFEQSSGKKINLTAEEQKSLKESVLENIINEKLLQKLINEMDLIVSDNVVIEELKKVPVFIDENGLFNQAKFDNFLKEIGKSEKEYLRDMKEKMALYGVFNSFNKSYSNIALRTKLLSAHANKSRLVDFIEVPNQHYMKVNYKSKQEDLLNYYNNNQELYALPEYRKISYIKFNTDNFKPEITIDNKELDKRINDKLSMNEGQEIRDFYNIICKNENDSKRIHSYIQKLGFENYITKTANLESIIKNDLKLNSCIALKMNQKMRNNLPEEFQTIVFDQLNNNAENYLSQPIKTDMGSHILLFLNSRNLSRQDIEPEIKNELLEEATNESIIKTIDKIKNNLDQYRSLDAIIVEFKLKGSVEKTELFDENGEIKNSSNNNMLLHSNFSNDFISHIFSSENNQIKIEQNNADYYIYSVDIIEPSKIKTFEDVKDQIMAHAMSEFQAKEFDKIVEKVKLNRNIDDLKKEYKDLIYTKNMEIANPILSKIIKPNHNFTDEVVNKVFIAAKDDVLGFIAYQDNGIIIIAADWKNNELDEETADKLIKMLDYDLYMSDSNEIYQATLKYLKNKYKVVNYLKAKPDIAK